MESNDASEVDVYETDPFEVCHRWALRWDLWRRGRSKKKIQTAEQEFLPRCLDVLLVRDGVGAELDPDEERFDPKDVEVARSLLAPLFARHSLTIVGLTLRWRSDDGDNELVSVMVTFC